MQVDEIFSRLSKKSVGIAGAGGLGSNCAVSLVRSGIGKLVIADFDVVSEGNLNRQFYFRDQIGIKKVIALRDNLLRINPNLQITIHDKFIDSSNAEEIFEDCDILVEAFDKAECKAELLETMLDRCPERVLVMGSGMAGVGNLESLKVQNFENVYICGDGTTEVTIENPPLAPRVMIVSNMEADVVLRKLLE